MFLFQLYRIYGIFNPVVKSRACYNHDNIDIVMLAEWLYFVSTSHMIYY